VPTRKRACNLIAALVLGGCLLAPQAARACQVPVFRYALERWPAEPYEVVVFRQGPLGQAEKQLLARVGDSEKSSTNIVVTDVDIAGEVAEPLQRLWKAQAGRGGEAKAPWLVVRRTEEGEDDLPAVWAGRLDAANVAALLDSPARREVAKQILSGQSVVFVLVESGDKGADERAAKVVREQLAKLEKTLALPEIDPEEPGPRVLSALPLKLGFSLVRVSRSDPAEAPFAAMLLQGLMPAQPPKSAKGEPEAEAREAKPVSPKGPVLVPVFGQGRALCALEGGEIDAQHIEEVAVFLTGACSCQVKQLNPGYDLLMKADWRSILDEGATADGDAARERNREPRTKVPDPVIGPGKKGLKKPGPATRDARQ
jgi:CheY-like chemotaxis protein